MPLNPETNTITLSYTEITNFVNCPYAHHLKHVKRISMGDLETEYLSYGKSIHKAAESLFKTRDVVASQKIFEDELKMYWEKYKFNDIQSFLDAGLILLSKLANSNIINEKFISSELQLLYNIKDNVFFKGYIDLLTFDEQTGKVNISDFKTTKNGWANIKANDFLTKLQLYLYHDYLSKQFEHGLDKFHCKFILLITNTKSIEVLDVPLNEYEIRQSTELVDSIVEALYFSKDNKWKLKFKNSYNCKFCEYKGTEHCTNDTQEDFKVITEKEHVKVLKNDQPVDGKTLYIPWRDNLFIQQQQQPVDYMGDLRKLLKNRKNIYGESETRDTTEENKEDKNTAC